MLASLEQTLGKSCVIGLSYFDHQQQLVKQSMVGGTVIAIDKDQGITIELAKQNSQASPNEPAHFIIPADLSCWFIAPKGNFHTSNSEVKIHNPDYLITWDIYQTKGDKADGEQQWWQWSPRTTPPQMK